MNGPVQAAHSLRAFLAVVVTVAVLRYAEEVFVPLALAILLTFLLAPLVEKLQRWGINRAVAVIVSVSLAVLILGGLAWVVFQQFVDLVSELPRYRQQLRANLGDLTSALRGGVSETTQAVEQLTRELSRAAPGSRGASQIPKVEVVEPTTPVESLRQLIEPMVKPVTTAALVLVFVIFMLLRLPDLRDRVISLLGSKNLRVTTEALDEAARKVSQYIVMQTVINGWQGILTAIGLYLIGVPNAVLWGALSMVLRFIPYVGIWVAAAMPVTLSFALFDNWAQPLLVAILFLGLEAFSYVVLEPWLYGSRTGVSPIALLVAAAFWTWLWGPIGLLLAIPITVCLVVMGKYIPQLAFLHVLLGDQPVLAPHERLYQRLLASNRDEADDLLEAAVKTQSPVEVCDAVIIPTLQLAEGDSERGLLPEAKRSMVLDHIERWADEFDASREIPAAPPGNPTTPTFGRNVLCIPAEDQADLITTKLLDRVLQDQGVRSRLVRNGSWAEQARPDAVIVSALPPDAFTSARHVCRAIRAKWPDVPVIVGLWNARGDWEHARQRLRTAGATHTCSTFAECLALLELQFSHTARQEATEKPIPATS